MATLVHSATVRPSLPHPAFVATHERAEEAHAPSKDGDSEVLVPRLSPSTSSNQAAFDFPFTLL